MKIPSPTVPAPPRRKSLLKKTTVLLVDDNAEVRKGLRALLKEDGQSGVKGQARNGREAVKLAHTLQPDVILMDIAMPILNSFEATLQILIANPAANVRALAQKSGQ